MTSAVLPFMVIIRSSLLVLKSCCWGPVGDESIYKPEGIAMSSSRRMIRLALVAGLQHQ